MTTNETSISSATLTYGSGNCSIIGTEIQGVQIHYTGIVKITKTCDDNFHIAASHNKILIFPIGLGSLTTLFDYIGEFKIKSVIVVDINAKVVDTTINRMTNLSESIKTKAEDLTIKSENLNIGDVYKNKVKRTTVDVQYIENRNTATDNVAYYTKDGNKYHGSYNIHIGTAVARTGDKHTEKSDDLYIMKIMDDQEDRLVITGIRRRPLTKKRIRPKPRGSTPSTGGGY